MPLFGQVQSYFDDLHEASLLLSYCREELGDKEAAFSGISSEYVISTLKNIPEIETMGENELGRMCQDLAKIIDAKRRNIIQRGADCGQLSLSYTEPATGAIEALALDMAEVTAYLERDRELAKGARTQDEVFRLADGLLDRQLEVFNQVNALSPAADRNDKFLVRTVKDTEMNEDEFKKRSVAMGALLDMMIEQYEKNGAWEYPSYAELRERLADIGHPSMYLEAGYAIRALAKIKEEMDEGWNVGDAMPPAGSARGLSRQVEKFKKMRTVAAKALNDDQKLSADEFYYYSYFISSRRQQTTMYVQPEKGAPYLPFKNSKAIGLGPHLSRAMGSKLVEGDIRQPEGFMQGSWGGSSANVLSGYGKWMYYRSHVNYGADESEPERNKLRQSLSASGLRGPKGGLIRIHADVGSVGCLELPIEDSVAIAGLARRKNNPEMQTIPFPFTSENLEYFGNKVEGHGEFWKHLAREEKRKFEYAPAIAVDAALESAQEAPF